MESVEKYFRKKVENIRFIELKDSLYIPSKNITIRGDLPLPMIIDDFIEGIKEKGINDEINLSYIIDGIIYTIGIDSEFPYIDEYKEFLIRYNENITEYILYQAMKDLEKEDYDNSGVKLRALLNLDSNNVNGLFNYGVAIEGIGKNYIVKEDKDKGEQFLKYSTKILEGILDIEEDFSPTYYKLGYHYKYYQQYLKASLIWKKFIQLSKEDILVQEIREEIDIIEDDSNLETGLTYLNYGDYQKALDFLLRLIPKYKNNWDINYFIGKAYIGLEEWDMAIDFISQALEIHKEADIYNELGISYFNNGDINNAIEVFNEAIENFQKDYKLYFNRGLAYVQIDEYKKALVDISKAYELNPEDENIRSQKETIERLMYNK